MDNRTPYELSDIRRFFLEPQTAKQRQYEALRAYFIEELPSKKAAQAFGYSVSAFHVLCHHFRRDPDRVFFVTPRRGPRSQPKKSAARDLIVQLRKSNYSVYEISETLKEQKLPLSPTAVREVLKAEGFAALPRRLDEERPNRPRPTSGTFRWRRAGSRRHAADCFCFCRIWSGSTSMDWQRTPGCLARR